MGLQYTSSRGDLGGGRYLRLAKNLRDIVEEEMAVAGEEGVAEAKAFVEIAGTQHTWSGRFRGREGAPAGRIDTRKMIDALDYRITRGNRVGVDVGWVHFWEEYFGAQDAGFSAGGFRPSQTVEGMGLLSHLRAYMRVRVDMALDRVMRRIDDGL